jgi:hypothetical protein
MIPISSMRRGKASPKTSRPRRRKTRSNRSNLFSTSSQSLSFRDHVLQPRPSNGNVHTFTQWLGETTVAQTATTPSYSATFNAFSQLDQYATFAALFDQYRITRVDLEFRPAYTANSLSLSFGGATPAVCPLIYVVVDYDDATTPASLAAFRQYENCQVHQYESFTISYVPHAAVCAYASGTFTSYANVTSPWIDCSSIGVQHYGWKTGITAGLAGAIDLQYWNVSQRLTIQFRNVR